MRNFHHVRLSFLIGVVVGFLWTISTYIPYYDYLILVRINKELRDA
jgi:hypothetical protein